MKSLRILLVALVGLAFFAMGIWFFSPWETGGVYLLDKIRLFAAKNGVYMTYAEATSSGLVFPKYRLKDFSIEGPMFRTAMPEITITVLPFSSLLAGGGSCWVAFHGGEIRLFPDNVLKLEGGGAKFSVSGSSVKISGAKIEGDLEMTGSLAYDRASGGISGSTMRLKAPESIGTMFSNPLFGKYIESVGPGEWRLK